MVVVVVVRTAVVIGAGIIHPATADECPTRGYGILGSV